MYREDSQTHRRTLIGQPNHSRRQLIRIDILPDDVLLEIFDFYTYPRSRGNKAWTEKWQLLVHICRRWRSLVLASPRRLNLQLFCTPATPARDRLDVWPALPLNIGSRNMASSSGTDNVIAALGQSNRVCRVDLWYLAGWQFDQVLAAMQVRFSELTYLRLVLSDVLGETRRLIPDSFLDGSAPRLRQFYLAGNIKFSGLTRLLLSAHHLVELTLFNIPYSRHVSPEAIVALLSALSSLEFLHLGFRSPQSRPNLESRRPPPPKRSVIPALVFFEFKGVTEYLEDLVFLIDTSRLRALNLRFFNQIDFDTPRLAQFINRTFKLAKTHGYVQFDDDHVEVQLGSGTLEIRISCKEPDWQVSSMEQVCNSSFHHPLSAVEDFYIVHRYRNVVWKGDSIEGTLWLQLLLPFTAVKNLYLAKEFSHGIAAALKELAGDRTTEVLPSLQIIFTEGLEPSGHFQETIGQFVAARQLSGHPVTVSDWRRQ